MQICTSPQTDNHASIPPLSFLQAGCPSCRPTNSVKALNAKALKAETWPVRKENELALQQAEMRVVRWMCDIKVKDRVPGKKLS